MRLCDTLKALGFRRTYYQYKQDYNPTSGYKCEGFIRESDSDTFKYIYVDDYTNGHVYVQRHWSYAIEDRDTKLYKRRKKDALKYIKRLLMELMMEEANV